MQEFIELVKVNHQVKAIEYAKKHLVKFAQENSDQELMDQVIQAMGIVAFPIS